METLSVLLVVAMSFVIFWAITITDTTKEKLDRAKAILEKDNCKFLFQGLVMTKIKNKEGFLVEAFPSNNAENYKPEDVRIIDTYCVSNIITY